MLVEPVAADTGDYYWHCGPGFRSEPNPKCDCRVECMICEPGGQDENA